MVVIVIIAAIIIVVVLTLTSRSYAEVPVLLMTFGAAALLNMGTNFLCGTISFISNSVTVILQLALAIDYAIILCHRFSDEHETLPTREACIAALSKAIPEISSSSLTTISGLAALAFMHFGIGRDLATVLIKAILFSMLCVFTLMPGLLVLFSKLIDKTRHKNLIPKITAVGKFDIKTRFIIPPIFGVIIVAAAVFANLCPYCYTYTDLVTAKQSERQIAYQKIKNTFGSSNMVAVIVPSGDYESEGRILDELDACAEVKSTMGLANIEAMDGYMLTDAVTPRQLAEMADLDFEVAKALYGAYAVDHDEYGEIINGLDDYKVPIYDMFRFLEQEMHDGNITLSGDVQDTLDDLFDQLDEAQKQLQSDDYSRMVVYLNLPEETDETFAFVNKMHDIIGKYYATDSFYVVGNTTSAMDLSSSFGEDNLLISVLYPGPAVHIQVRGSARAADHRHSGQYLDQLLGAVPAAHPAVLPRLPDRQLHSDGCKHRLRHRYLQPLHRPEEGHAPAGGHRHSLERVVPDHLHLRLHSGIRGYSDQRPDHEPRYLRHRHLPGPRHDRFHRSGSVCPAANPDPGRHHHRAHEL